MSESESNPHKLIAQYVKARKIATWAFATGYTLRADASEADLALIGGLARTATPPSEETIALAVLLLEETHEMRAGLDALAAEVRGQLSVLGQTVEKIL